MKKSPKHTLTFPDTGTKKYVEKEDPIPTWLQPFYYSLKARKLTEKTSIEQVANISRFNTWANENHYSGIDLMTYQDILKYVDYLKAHRLAISTVNIRLANIRNYYTHLKEEGIISKNPASRIIIRGHVKKIITDPLTTSELDKLYMEYSMPKAQYHSHSNQYQHLKRIVLFGFMTYQALHTGELAKLKLEHIDLTHGTLRVPATSKDRGTERMLKLEAKQIVAIHRYIEQSDFTSLYLFENTMSNLVQYLLEELRGLNPLIQNAQHIRASVILNWLKIHDKRQVQYMVGHRTIGSTEEYEVQELDSLIDLVSKHHPFG